MTSPRQAPSTGAASPAPAPAHASPAPASGPAFWRAAFPRAAVLSVLLAALLAVLPAAPPAALVPAASARNAPEAAPEAAPAADAAPGGAAAPDSAGVGAAAPGDEASPDAAGEGADPDLAEGEVAYDIEPVEVPEAPIPRAVPPSIVMVAPTSGPWAVIGHDAELGATMGLKSVGGGFELRILDEDSPRLLRELVGAPAPMVAMGHLYETTLAAAWPWYVRAEVPVIAPFLDRAALADLGPGAIGLAPDPALQGVRLADAVPKTAQRRPAQVLVLQGPDPADEILAEAFREQLKNPVAPPPTKANPNPRKPAALHSRVVVTTIPVNSPADLAVLAEITLSNKDLVLLALPARLALKAAPVLAATRLKKASILAPSWLAVREVGALFLALDLTNLQVLVPLDLGASNRPNKSLEEMTTRYTRLYRREPTWAAVLAYDVARLSALAASAEGGPALFLADRELERSGSAGTYTLGPGGWPTSLMRVEPGKLSYLP